MNKPFIIGLAYLLSITGLSYLLNHFIHGLSPILWALILGLVSGNLFNLKKNFGKALTFGEKEMLAVAIVLLGFQMDFSKIASILWLVPVLILMIILSIFLGQKLAPAFKIDQECGILLGAGNAICGTSAIASIAPVIKAKPYQTAISISVIHLLGTLALLLIPVLIPILKLESEAWGIITGGTFQAVGQAIGAGYTVNPMAGEIATIVKLARVLMLGPVVLYFSLKRKKDDVSTERPKLPLFIYGFVLAALLGNFFPVIQEQEFLMKGQDFFLVLAMAAIGSKIFYKDLLVSGPKALKLGSLIFVFQIVFMVAFIWLKAIMF